MDLLYEALTDPRFLALLAACAISFAASWRCRSTFWTCAWLVVGLWLAMGIALILWGATLDAPPEDPSQWLRRP